MTLNEKQKCIYCIKENLHFSTPFWELFCCKFEPNTREGFELFKIKIKFVATFSPPHKICIPSLFLIVSRPFWDNSFWKCWLTKNAWSKAGCWESTSTKNNTDLRLKLSGVRNSKPNGSISVSCHEQYTSCHLFRFFRTCYEIKLTLHTCDKQDFLWLKCHCYWQDNSLSG